MKRTSIALALTLFLLMLSLGSVLPQPALAQANFAPSLEVSAPTRRSLASANTALTININLAFDEETLRQNNIKRVEIFYYMPQTNGVTWLSSSPQSGDSVDDQRQPPQLRKFWTMDTGIPRDISQRYRVNLALTTKATPGILKHEVVIAAYGDANGQPAVFNKIVSAETELTAPGRNADNWPGQPLKLSVISSPRRYALDSQQESLRVFIQYSIDIETRDRMGLTNATVYYDLPGQGLAWIRSEPLSYNETDTSKNPPVKQKAWSINLQQNPIGTVAVYMAVGDEISADTEITHNARVVATRSDGQEVILQRFNNATTQFVEAGNSERPESNNVGPFILRVRGEPTVIDLGVPGQKTVVITIDYRIRAGEVAEFGLYNAELFYYLPNTEQISWQSSSPASGDSTDDAGNMRKVWSIDLTDRNQQHGLVQLFFNVSDQRLADVVAHRAVLKADGRLGDQDHTFTHTALLTTPVVSSGK